IRLFPHAKSPTKRVPYKAQAVVLNRKRMAIIRHRLGNLSWLTNCLAEPIARQANHKDSCNGRFVV
ncbi:MAG: hypothetical protein ABIP02_03785, partial [Arenimonas sp.]